jgi:hypothetical protein
MLPAMRWRPWPRSISIEHAVDRLQLRRERAAHIGQCGKGGDDQRHRRGDLPCGPFSACQRVRIDKESLPTGMPMPRAGHSSRPTALHGVVQRGVFAGLRRRPPSSWR